MNLYLDSSAVVKRYILETHSAEVMNLINTSKIVITSIITRVEVTAALTKACRLKFISESELITTKGLFYEEWDNFVRLPINEQTVLKAGEIAVQYSLRAYDAVHLASAVIIESMIEGPVALCTFDESMKHAGRQLGFSVDLIE